MAMSRWVFRSDPCGVVCLLIIYATIIYADYAVIFQIVLPFFTDTLWIVLHITAFNVFLFLMILSHLKAVLCDPGIVPLAKAKLDFSDLHTNRQLLEKRADGWTICIKCETFRPPRSHHCRICKRCIRKMDHHCPWINNCVGEFNQKYFLLFLFYVGVCTAYAEILVVVSWVAKPRNLNSPESGQKVLHTVILSVICVLFLCFVCAIGTDQLSGVFSDSTIIEQKQVPRSQRHLPPPDVSKFDLIQDVCGQSSYFLLLVLILSVFINLQSVITISANRLQYDSIALFVNILEAKWKWICPFFPYRINQTVSSHVEDSIEVLNI